MKTDLKRMLCLALTAVLLLSLAACGNSPKQAIEAPTVPQNQDASTTEPEVTQGDAASESGHRFLIAYFTAAENSDVDAVSSASVVTVDGAPKGRVQALAEMIQRDTSGDLFSIRTSTVYPGDGSKLVDFAAEEQNAKARPELTTHIENLDAYDVIFVGYPTWWYDLPMVMYSFFEEYDFSGKTIVPFNVHNGSRFSGTIATIQELEPNATVVTDGFTVSERTVANAAKDVSQWLDGLGY